MKMHSLWLRLLTSVIAVACTAGVAAAGITATGGTVADIDGDRVHTFTSSGTFSVSGSGDVQVLVVAGGGGGGGSTGGGGGAGGFIYADSYTVSPGDYMVTVGAGGAGGVNNVGANGGNSIFGTLTAIGGGAGGANAGTDDGQDGGSGGGGSYLSGFGTAGTGTTGQGNDGGVATHWTSPYPTGGGGGAGAAGADGSATTLGHGGDGLSSDISGTTTWYAGGGGGGNYNGDGGTGGVGGGGQAAGKVLETAENGTPNTGGGGGGMGQNRGTQAGSGGSGIVIVRYSLGDGPNFSALGVSNVTATAASPYATVSTNLTSCTLVWDTVDKGNTNLLAWTGSSSLGAQSVGLVTGNATSLSSDTEYFFRFYGEDGTTNTWSGTGAFDTQLTDSSKPAFISTTSTFDSVTLEWTDNAATETGYVLRRSTNDIDYVAIAELDAGIEAFLDEGLQADTTYYYQLAATNDVNESSTTSSACATNVATLYLPPPTTLTWDPAASGGSDGNGTWLDSGEWWDGAASATWLNASPDNAVIGSGGAGGTITLGDVTAGTVLLDNFTGNYTLSGGPLTLNDGLTIATNAGNVNLCLPIDGTGGLTVNCPGLVDVRNGGAKTFSGNMTIGGGSQVMDHAWDDLGTGNLTISNGVLVGYWGDLMNRSLGAGAGQVRVPGGRSGFCGAGRNGATVRFGNNDNIEVVWGSAEFKPTTLVLQSPWSNLNGKLTWRNKLDLNGVMRTIDVDRDHQGDRNGYAQMINTICNGTNTLAGIIKTGPGRLVLTAANTYDGPVDVQEGILAITSVGNAASANPLGQSSAAPANLLLGDGAVLEYRGGAASCDRGFTINGTEDGASATLDAIGSGALDLSATSSPAYGVPDQTRTLVLDGTSGHDNTLAANIADNGTGAVSVTKSGTGKWILSGNSSYSGATTVADGALTLPHSKALPSATALYLYSGATGIIDLAFAGSQQIAALYIDGVQQPNGVYGANGVTISGTGFLSVGQAGTLIVVR